MRKRSGDSSGGGGGGALNTANILLASGASPVGWWVPMFLLDSQHSTGAATTNWIYAWPFCVPMSVTSSRVCFWNKGAAVGESARVGIYNTAAGGTFPNALLVDSGDLARDTVGCKSAAVTTTLEPGQLYWFAIHATNATNLMVLGASTNLRICTQDAANADAWPLRNVQHNMGAYGALPAVFPVAAVWSNKEPIGLGLQFV